MDGYNSSNIYSNLNDQQQFRLNEISTVRDYFIGEIRERELMSNRLSKYTGTYQQIVDFRVPGSNWQVFCIVSTKAI